MATPFDKLRANGALPAKSVRTVYAVA